MPAGRYDAAIVVVHQLVELANGNFVPVVAGVFHDKLRGVGRKQSAENRVSVCEDDVEGMFQQNVDFALYISRFYPN